MRSSNPASGWVGDRGFLDKPTDSSGLTQVGARYYDPLTGAFISVDRLMELDDPQQWQAYAYSNNNPVTWSDPTGLSKNVMRDGASGGYSGPVQEALAKDLKTQTSSSVTAAPVANHRRNDPATYAYQRRYYAWGAAEYDRRQRANNVRAQTKIQQIAAERQRQEAL